MSKYFNYDPEKSELTIFNLLEGRNKPIFTININDITIPLNIVHIKKDGAIDTFIKNATAKWDSSGMISNFSADMQNTYKLRKDKTNNTRTIKLSSESLKLFKSKIETTLKSIDTSIRYTEAELTACITYVNDRAAIGALFGLSENNIYKAQLLDLLEAITMLIEDKSKAVYVAESGRLKDILISSMIGTLSLRTPSKPQQNQYKLSALKAQSNDKDAEYTKEYIAFRDLFHSHIPSVRNTIEIVKFVSEPAKHKDIVVNLDVLMPELEANLKTFVTNFSTQFARGQTSSGGLMNGRINHIASVWLEFNDIKCKLMLLGHTEKEAVDIIVTKGLNNKDFNHHPKFHSNYVFTSDTCAITKQLMLDLFLIPVRFMGFKEPVKAAHYFISQVSNKNIRRFNYDEHADNWYEQELQENEYYNQSMQSHNKSALEYLSPRSLSTENIKVFDKEKLYEPVPFLGVEVEVERNDGCKEAITEDVLRLVGHDYIILKTDGSLRGHKPFEIVTVPATLAYHKEKWKSFMSKENAGIKQQLRSYASGNCGMHVHVSRESFTGLHLAKFLRFINSTENHAFITRLAGRGDGQYTRYTHHGEAKHLKAQLSSLSRYAAQGVNGGANGHYDAVSTSSRHGTIEVRIFRGNLAKSHFYKNIEFVHALWTYTKNCSMRELDYKDFIFWLFKDNCKLYNHLQDWLIAAGYNVSNRNVDTEIVKKEIKKVQLIVNKKYNTTSEGNLRTSKNSTLTKSELLANY